MLLWLTFSDIKFVNVTVTNVLGVSEMKKKLCFCGKQLYTILQYKGARLSHYSYEENGSFL